ncbi:Rrf2 family transcriptional regulator [Verticiella sediminum]|uniref:Rrf2 family transcriptional regulator n=1 Tax=Verticiella sediminum TaxID=1247510 RepID=UPI00336D36B5
MKRDSRLSSVLHALLRMAEQDGPLTSETLARCLGTKPVVVRRSMGYLREAGIATSDQGHAGGWRMPVCGGTTHNKLIMHHDVIVIGESYAAMAAALQLVRARRSVQVIDAGERRKRFGSHSHGFPGQDGVPPGESAVNARGRREAMAGRVDEFTVKTSDGGSHRGRRILLATGGAGTEPGGQVHRSLLWPESLAPMQAEGGIR